MAYDVVYGQKVSKSNLRAPKVNKQILINDLDAMERGELGLTESQQDQIIDRAGEQQRAMINAQNAISARQAMGKVPGVASGQQMEMQKQIAGSQAQASAMASAQAAKLSQSLAEAKRQEILARLEGQQDRRRENTMYATNLASENLQASGDTAGQVATAVAMSDIRLKSNIICWGESPSGIPVYTFEYKAEPGVLYTGAMAQDLLVTRPEAVVTQPNGMYAVQYDLIDVDFKKVKA